MNFKEMTGKSLRDAFTEFHNDNPKVYQAFEKEAFRAIKAGRKKLSAKLILNFIRWNYFIESTDENFKINDGFQSYYGRLFMELHPDHADKFETRKLRNEQEGPYCYIGPTGQISFVNPNNEIL